MPLEAVKREAEFFNIQPLVRAVERLMRDKEMATSDITKAEFFQCLTMARIKGFMLSMAGMKMRGIDFSHMQLLNVHFSSCDLEVKPVYPFASPAILNSFVSVCYCRERISQMRS